MDQLTQGQSQTLAPAAAHRGEWAKVNTAPPLNH